MIATDINLLIINLFFIAWPNMFSMIVYIDELFGEKRNCLG